MSMPRRTLLLFSLLLALGGCRQEGPLERVQQNAAALQEALQKKDAGTVMDLLHDDFLAQDQYRRDWAQRSMALYFLRHKKIGVSILNQESRLDSSYSDRAYSSAQVLLTGADNLLPDSARSYDLKLEWWLVDGDWQLARLAWE